MDAQAFSLALARRDADRINEATQDWEPAVIGETWDGEDVCEGDDIWTLKSGDIVFNDIPKMEDYLRAQVKEYGSVDKWAHYDIEGPNAMELILAMLKEPLDLETVFESYYGGEHRGAEL